MEPKNKYFHFRLLGKNDQHTATGGATISYTLEEDKMFFAIAICHPKENFCKKLGRLVADFRLKDNPQKITKVELFQSLRLQNYFNLGTPLYHISHQVLIEFFREKISEIANY